MYGDWGWGWGWAPHVSVKQRRLQASRELDKRRKQGQSVSPVTIAGRTIVTTFWGRSWCENLERYSDFASRLPRGRSYVRNGAVIDLQISSGEVKALVCGSEVYEIAVKVSPLTKARWRSICRDCAGGIDSLVELLQGRLSTAVMQRICRQNGGLFPSPKEIKLSCSCPDWAEMCKHVAAVLYGIGARFDWQPELLFKLHGVDEKELLAHAGAALPLAKKRPATAKVLGGQDLSELFGLDIAQPTVGRIATSAPAPAKARRVKARGKKKITKRPAKKMAPSSAKAARARIANKKP